MGPQARALFEKASNSGYNPGYPDVSSAVFETSPVADKAGATADQRCGFVVKLE
jgi:hypothetical protein